MAFIRNEGKIVGGRIEYNVGLDGSDFINNLGTIEGTAIRNNLIIPHGTPAAPERLSESKHWGWLKNSTALVNLVGLGLDVTEKVKRLFHS